MTTPGLFIGVVSHPASRFAISQGPDGLAAGLQRALTARGLDVITRVNTANLHDARVLPVTPELVQGSLTAQRRLEDAWMAHVRAGAAASAGDRARSLLRWGRRQWRRIRPPGAGPVTRLINIELSHIDLLRAGIASGAPWILIVEDDAMTRDLEDCADGLLGLLDDAPATVAFVNVSESFPLAELGIAALLSPSEITWRGRDPRAILTASRPVTNTVCAILYRRGFAEDLLGWWDRQPIDPVVPIDWRLNQALMDVFAAGRLGADSCWLVSPAPIDQMSMQSGGGA